MDKFTYRFAAVSDAAALLKIYRPYIENSAVSFEIEVPSIEEFENRIKSTLENFPWIIACYEDEIAGYVYAGALRSRCAYNWSVESSVYISEKFQKKGLGRALYEKLFEVLKQQGVVNVFAGATLPNEGSVKLHESMGFKAIGVYKKVGFKNGEWWDVGWWQLELSNPENAPELIPFSKINFSL